MLEQTRTCDAHYYLDDTGSELTREEFLRQNPAWHSVMLYVGPGFVPLRVAVLTADARDTHRLGSDEAAAVEVFDEWCRRTDRLDEIGEGDPTDPYFGEYELRIEAIPPVVGEREPT